jgi:hypothetical protein
VIADFTKALELDPSLAFFWQERSDARLAKGDRDGAVADLEQAALRAEKGSRYAKILRDALATLRAEKERGSR